MIQINAGFFYGQHEDPPDFAEAEEQRKRSAKFTPHELGEFRRAYWEGRIHALFNFSLLSLGNYLTLPQMKAYHARLTKVHFETLVDIYGSAEAAQKHLDEMEALRVKGRSERA